MRPSLVYPLAAVFAFLATFALVGAMLPWLRRRVVAQLTDRSSHTVPTPQGGGLAVVAVTLATCGGLIAAGVDAADPGWAIAAALCAGSLLLTGIGVADDMGSLPIGLRFAGQALAVVGLVAVLPADLRLLPASVPVPLAVERAATAFAGLWFVNLFNFMDGIDWISFIEVTTIGGGVCLLWRLGLAGDAAGVTALVLTSATAGFAVWNRPRAAVFLGDAGSLPMGFLLVWLMVDTAARGAWTAVVLFSLYYWADATLTLLRRMSRRERVWTAHREHFYQQATRKGRHGVPRTLGAIAVVDCMLVVLGVGAELTGGLAVRLAALALGCALVAALLRHFWDPGARGNGT